MGVLQTAQDKARTAKTQPPPRQKVEVLGAHGSRRSASARWCGGHPCQTWPGSETASWFVDQRFVVIATTGAETRMAACLQARCSPRHYDTSWSVVTRPGPARKRLAWGVPGRTSLLEGGRAVARGPNPILRVGQLMGADTSARRPKGRALMLPLWPVWSPISTKRDPQPLLCRPENPFRAWNKLPQFRGYYSAQRHSSPESENPRNWLSEGSLGGELVTKGKLSAAVGGF